MFQATGIYQFKVTSSNPFTLTFFSIFVCDFCMFSCSCFVIKKHLNIFYFNFEEDEPQRPVLESDYQVDLLISYPVKERKDINNIFFSKLNCKKTYFLELVWGFYFTKLSKMSFQFDLWLIKTSKRQSQSS